MQISEAIIALLLENFYLKKMPKIFVHEKSRYSMNSNYNIIHICTYNVPTRNNILVGYLPIIDNDLLPSKKNWFSLY